VLPLLFIRILHFLGIHVIVDLLDQPEPHHAVIGLTLNHERLLALFSGLIVERVDAVGIKDLVDTVIGKRLSSYIHSGCGRCLQW
jgi:hypothetical protein